MRAFLLGCVIASIKIIKNNILYLIIDANLDWVKAIIQT